MKCYLANRIQRQIIKFAYFLTDKVFELFCDECTAGKNYL